MMRLYAVVDRKAKAVVATFQSVNDDAAARSFLSLLTTPHESVFTQFPEDFAVYPMAELDYDGASLVVMKHDSKILDDHCFKSSSFSSSDPVASGSDYDRDVLKLKIDRRKERIEEVVTDGE